MRKIFGYAMLVLSVLVYGPILILPLFYTSVEWAAVIVTGLVITGEIAFVIAIALLGKDVYEKMKVWVGLN